MRLDAQALFQLARSNRLIRRRLPGGRLAGPRVPTLIPKGLNLPATIELWTVQTPEAFAAISKHGVLEWPDIQRDRRHNFPSGITAYKWMRDQLRHHTSDPSIKGLIWAWHRPLVRVNIATRRWPMDGDEAVLLRLRVPTRSALLSWFNPWEHVMHCVPIGRSDREEQMLDRLLLADQLSHADIRRTWRRIFEFAPCSHSSYGNPSRWLMQAVLPRVCVQDIVEAHTLHRTRD